MFATSRCVRAMALRRPCQASLLSSLISLRSRHSFANREASLALIPGAMKASALLAQRRHNPDATSSASIVIVDQGKAAEERDRLARDLLTSNVPEAKQQQRVILQLKDLIHTVPYSLTIATEDVEHQTETRALAQDILNKCFDMVDTLLNHFNEESEVSLVNRLPVNEPHVMSPQLRAVMSCCQEVYRVSGGCFDPATAPLARRLRTAAADPNAPAEAFAISAEEAELFTLPHSFDIDLKKGTIARKHKDAALDLGAVNKGYTVDYVVEQLNKAGVENVLFEWGGDVRASGTNVRRQPWAVGIVKPPTLQELRNEFESNGAVSSHPAHLMELASKNGQVPSMLRVMTLQNESLCTSGDYVNVIYHAATDNAFSSIYDWQQRTMLKPCNDQLAQVSVKCATCMYADALATAGLVKRDPSRVRYLMENYRYNSNYVSDYAAYMRQGERLAHMFEISRESPTRRAERIAGSLPARVIVIGGGLAGCAAAIEAANCGAQVILLEKESKLGGNSAKATSGINGWGTRAQAKQGVIDGGKYFERDTYRSGRGGDCDPGLVRMLSVKSADAIRWLTALGVPLSVLSQLGGASRKRCHRAPDKSDGTPVPIGFTIMRILENHIRTKLAQQVTVMTNVNVNRLEYVNVHRADGIEQKRVTGVQMTKQDGEAMKLSADAVILATGGFSNDRTSRSLLQEFAPQLASFPTTNGPWATGDGVKMARELGVELVDMDKVQLHPTGLIDPKDPANRTKYLGPEALRGSGGVLINKSGERFVNELDLRSVVSQAIIAQNNEYPGSNGSKFAYCVLNENAVSLFGKNALGFYWKRLGLFEKVNDVKELAKLIGCSEETLTNTLTQYEKVSREGLHACPNTGKNVFPCVLGPQGPFYVAFVTPSIHYTMGGCLISPSAEVQSSMFDGVTLQRRPILGLFGAGEVTGGVHGKNRLGGNSLLECVVFGRIAGDRAATILQKRNTALSMNEWATVVLREVLEGGVYGLGSRVLRFNLPGALQKSGLALGQFIGIRGEWDGRQLIGYYSPITLPDVTGVIGILARSDKGNLREWISALQPGDAVEMKGCGGLVIERRFTERYLYFKNYKLRKLALIAGGTGVAPMLQILRAALKRPFVDFIQSINLIYAAEDVAELTYRGLLESFQNEFSTEKFKCHFVLNHPPPRWTDGVGFVDAAVLRTAVQPPANDLLVVICGPPIMQRVVKQALQSQGYNMNLVRTVDETDPAPAKL